MPASFPCFDHATQQLLEWLAPATALDIGAGAGKYARLLAQAAPGCRRTALEVEARHVAQFGLDALYEEVVVEDAWSWCRRCADRRFDVVIAGDCLGHMPKSVGLDLLNAVVYRSAWVLVLAPEFVTRHAAADSPSESHVSVWSERDFQWHDRWAWDNCRAMSWILMRGYQPSAYTLEAVVQRFNAARLLVHDFDGQAVVRPAFLRMLDCPREVSYRQA